MPTPVTSNTVRWRLILGVIAILASVVAFVSPRIFEIAFSEIIAMYAIISTIPFVGMFFHPRNETQRGWAAIAAMISLGVGLLLFFFPVGSAESISMILALFFFLYGISKMIMAFRIESIPDRSLAIIAGAFCIVAGVVLGSFLGDLTVQHAGIATGIAFLLIGIVWLRSGLRAAKAVPPGA